MKESSLTAQQKIKKKSQKLTKQSFALLERIKAKKQKTQLVPNQQNYIEDLYYKIFDKCSPYFDKMETSNQILNEYKATQKEKKQIKKLYDQLVRENQQTKGELKKQRQINQAIKTKTSNEELKNLYKQRQECLSQIRSLKKQIKRINYEFQAQQQDRQKLQNHNNELEQLLYKLSQQMQANERKKISQNEVGQLKAQIQRLNQQINLLKQISNQAMVLKQQIEEKDKLIEKQKQKLESQSNKNNECLRQIQKNKLQFQDRLMKFTQEKTIVQSKVTLLQSTIKNIQIKLDQALQTKESLHRTIQHHLASNKLLQQNITKLTQQINTQKEQKFENAAIIQSYLQTNHRLLQQNELIQTKLTKVTNQSIMIKQQLSSKIDELKQRLKFFKENNQTLNNQKIDLITNIDLLTDQISTLNTTLEEKQTRIGALQKQKQGMGRKMQWREEQLASLYNKKQADYQRKIEQKQQYYENLIKTRQYQHNKILSQKSNLVASALAQSQENQSLKAVIHSRQTKIIQLNDLLQSLTNSQIKSKERLTEQAKSIQQAQCLFNKQVDTINQLQLTIEELKQRFKVTKDESDYLNQERAASKEENILLIKKIDEITHENSRIKQELTLNNEKILQLHRLQQQQQMNQPPQRIDVKYHQGANSKNKQMETIDQLSNELTEAYKMIQELEKTIQSFKQQQKPKKVSPQKKQRARSIKKIAGMFGF